MNNKYAIMIPVYRDPIITDILSLKQILKICNNDNIFFICSKNFDISKYEDIVKESMFEGKVFIEKFDDKYFTSINSYSKLCTTYELYDKFSNYEYILLYQLDCWIFENNIEYWCDKGYDYIGGPIFSRQANWISNYRNNYALVGNGGLSLRKVSTMKEIFDRSGEIFNMLDEEIKKYFDIDSDENYPEDVIICDIISKYYFLNIPNYKVASKFSTDWNVDIAYKINGNNLPMACHNIYKQYLFWQKFIEELNNEEVVEQCKKDIESIKSKSNIDNEKILAENRVKIVELLEKEKLL